MKKFLVFIGGIAVGMLLTLAITFILNKSKNNSNQETTFFPEVGECISVNNFKVFQVLDKGAALATEMSDNEGLNILNNTLGLDLGAMTVLFYSEEKYFYDNEIIKIPKKKCVRQIGVYKYKTQDDSWKTVPIVNIFNK